jgi:hypothetical protein
LQQRLPQWNGIEKIVVRKKGMTDVEGDDMMKRIMRSKIVLKIF